MKFLRTFWARHRAKKMTKQLEAKEKQLQAKKQRSALAFSQIQEYMQREHQRQREAIKIVPPYIMPRILPESYRNEGKQAIICDSAEPCYDPAMYEQLANNSYMRGVYVPFPGFQFLAQLSTQVEYINLFTTLADEATREWIEFVAVDANDDAVLERIKDIEREFNKFEIRALIHEAMVHDAMYGRAQILVDMKDTKDEDLINPLLIDAKAIGIDSIKQFKTVEALWTTPATYDSLRPQARYFYKPESWFMLGQQVHSTRLMTVTTRELPDMLKPAYNFAGMSLSQLVMPYIQNWLETRQATNNMLQMYSTTGLATNMAEILQGNDLDGSLLAGLLGRLEMFTLNRSNNGVFAFDKDNEELVLHNAPLTGLDKLQSQSLEQICAAARIPAVKYTGSSPIGLNASSEGEIQSYYDSTHAYQIAHWIEPLNNILKMVQLNLDGKIDPNIYIKFKSLVQNDEKEKAEIRKSDADRDSALVNARVISREEVRNRMSHDPDSGYTNIKPEDVPEPEVAPSVGIEGTPGVGENKPKPDDNKPNNNNVKGKGKTE